MWGGGSLQEGVSVKLQPASCSAEGGRQLAGSTLNPPGNGSVCDVNVVINVHGLLNDSNVQYLLDSGAAQSVVHYDPLDESQRRQITSVETMMLGANGLPLDVKGSIELPVRLGLFHANHPFIVVQNLTVDCLLGAGFLTEYGAVIDCQSANLSLGKETRTQVPLTLGQKRYKTVAAVTQPLASLASISPTVIVAPDTLEIACCSVHLLSGRLDAQTNSMGGGTGLVEPVDRGQPKHLLIGRTLSQISSEGKVFVQVVNVSSEPVKIHKGTKLKHLSIRLKTHIVHTYYITGYFQC